MRSACRFCFSSILLSAHLQFRPRTLILSVPLADSLTISSIFSKNAKFVQSRLSFLLVSYVDSTSSHFFLQSSADLCVCDSFISPAICCHIESAKSLVLLVLMCFAHKNIRLEVSLSAQEFSSWFSSVFSVSSVSIIIFSYPVSVPETIHLLFLELYCKMQIKKKMWINTENIIIKNSAHENGSVNYR